MRPKKEKNPPHGRWLKQLGRNVRAARVRAKLTQEKLAERSFLYPRTIQKIEAGLLDMKLTTLRRVAKALKAKLQVLIPS